MTFPMALCAALLLDALLGDPRRVPHPVRAIGWLVSHLEARLHDGTCRRGVALCCAVLGATGLSVACVLLVASPWPRALWAAEVLMLWWALACRSLKDETLPVALALFEHDLPRARTAVSRVVGRDVDMLDEEGVARAAVETVAESAVDGVFAPMLWAAFGWALGGGAGMAIFAWLFKAASTLDSMVGYDDERYRLFGRASARLDDALCFVPARAGGLAIVAASACVGGHPLRALRTFLRDRKKHASPNSAHAESAFAGALDLRLGGGATYAGTFEPRPWIGGGAPPRAADILAALRLLDASVALLALLIMLPFALS